MEKQRKQQRCPFLEHPVRDPCRAKPEECPKQRLKKVVTEFCYKVKVKKAEEKAVLTRKAREGTLCGEKR